MSRGATRVADRRNRRVLTVLGFVFIGAGAAGVVAGALDRTKSDPVITDDLARFGRDHSTWLWVGALAASLVLLVLFLLWLVSQLRPLSAIRQFELAADGSDDAVRISADAFVDQISHDVARGPGVRSAKGRLTSSLPMRATFDVVVDENVEADALAEFADTFVRRRAEHALGQPIELDLELVLQAPAPPPRVS